MTQRHKHADLIIAWANGAKIQVKVHNGLNGWKDCNVLGPEWHEHNEYRVKPEPKPDVVKYSYVSANTKSSWPSGDREDTDNLKFTFDGETGSLKSVEILR
jgi:hypothetical protein